MMTSATDLADGRYSVLIVDDVPANIQVLAEALSGEYQVRVASSGEEGLQVAVAHPPDLILLDIMMPRVDGFEVCRRLKADATTQNIPIIFITARDSQDDEERGLELGATDYITKPFHLPIVKARVQNHLKLKHRADILEELAHRDGLTGIANRRRFDEAIETELRRCQRAQKPLAVMMIDIDHFKQYNDHYGHGMGDDCLRQVAATLSDQLGRAADLVARYGGEEFAAVIPETDLAHAVVLAERLRMAVSELAIPHAALGPAGRVSISVGVAVHTPDQPIDVAGLVAAADRNLYAAKSSGRDRVVA